MIHAEMGDGQGINSWIRTGDSTFGCESLLDRAATADELDDQNDNRDDQQEMNKSTRNMEG